MLSTELSYIQQGERPNHLAPYQADRGNQKLETQEFEKHDINKMVVMDVNELALAEREPHSLCLNSRKLEHLDFV